MKNLKKILFAIFISTLFFSCKKGFIVIEKSENFKSENTALKEKHIVYFEPDISIYRIKKAVIKDFVLSEKEKLKVIGSLEKVGGENDIKVNVLNFNEVNPFLYDLLRLKSNIEYANLLQNNPLDKENYSAASNKVQQRVFVSSPRLAPEFSYLSDKFNTPYFGICGVVAVKAEPQSPETREFINKNKGLYSGQYFYFYNIISNVQTGEIVYREIKKVPIKFSRKNIFDVVAFDSFFTLKKNLDK